MESRIYFNRKALLRRLEENYIGINGDKDREFNTFVIGNQCSFHSEASDPKIAYAKITDYTGLRIPRILKRLKVIEVTLFEILLKEENLHINQGSGKEGKSQWTISYGDDMFNPPNDGPNWSEAYRSVIRIRVRGISIHSVQDCYNKIRKGETNNEWKGNGHKPSHCGLSVQMENSFQ